MFQVVPFVIDSDFPQSPPAYLPKALILGVCILIMPALLIWANQWWSGQYGVAVTNHRALDFTWTSPDGTQQQFSQWHQGYSVLFFGYLNCTDICPARLGQLRQLARDAQQLDVGTQFNMLFISIDPEDQNQGALARFSQTKFFQTGSMSAPELRQITTKVGEKVILNQKDISHSGNLYLINPSRELISVYTHKEINTQRLIEDINRHRAGT